MFTPFLIYVFVDYSLWMWDLPDLSTPYGESESFQNQNFTIIFLDRDDYYLVELSSQI